MRGTRTSPPAVTVIMPTYRQAAFVTRAVTSLLEQSMDDWELIVADDGSPDDTYEVLAEIACPRMTYLTLVRNEGIGHALNIGTAVAKGRYLAYLPSDDMYDRDHLHRVVGLLDADPTVYLAYGGVRWHPDPVMTHENWVATPTLRPGIPPGREAVVLDDPAVGRIVGAPLDSGNFLALTQVAHRRTFEEQVRWTERSACVSDRLEVDFWRELLRKGCRFRYTGAVTCLWSDHPHQNHKLISGRGLQGSDWRAQEYGLSRYKQHFRIAPGTPIRWQPANGSLPVDEHVRYAGLPTPPPPDPNGLRILVVGALGYNPERILALEERGHQLYGLWEPRPHTWDTTGPLPFGRTEDIRFDEDWVARVKEVRPHAVYALLNWQTLPFLHQVFLENRRSWGMPFIFHFKEGPHFAQRAGFWPELRELVLGADARVFSSAELRDWFHLALAGADALPRTMVLDGDLPKRDRMTSDWASRLSDSDGTPHTACVGRPLMGQAKELTRRRVHMHVYGYPYMRRTDADWLNETDHRYLHMHDAVEPAQWVAELSRYDAGWGHIFDSSNGGDMRRASSDDLNLPARLGTYASAGLPWIHRRNAGHRVAANTLADRLGVSLTYEDLDELAEILHRECSERSAAGNARARRDELSFDHHADDLVALIRSTGC